MFFSNYKFQRVVVCPKGIDLETFMMATHESWNKKNSVPFWSGRKAFLEADDETTLQNWENNILSLIPQYAQQASLPPALDASSPAPPYAD